MNDQYMPLDALDIDDIVLVDRYLTQQGAQWYHPDNACGSDDGMCPCHLFLERIKALVEAERESCAQIATRFIDNHYCEAAELTAIDIAEQIRAKGK